MLTPYFFSLSTFIWSKHACGNRNTGFLFLWHPIHFMQDVFGQLSKTPSRPVSWATHELRELDRWFVAAYHCLLGGP